MAIAAQTLQVILQARSSGFNAAFAQAEAQTKKFASSATAANRTLATTKVAAEAAAKPIGGLTRAMKEAAAAAKPLAGIAVAATLFMAAKAALEFDKNMRNVNSLSIEFATSFATAEQQVKSYSQAVFDMSKVLPQSANQLADAMYEISSSGFQGSDALTVLEASAKAASAGITDAKIASKSIVQVLNAYGLEVEDSTRVSDALFATVNYGIISFEELSTSLGRTVGIAAAAKIPIEEVGAAVAALTRAGAQPEESSIQLNQLINKIVKPSEELGFIIKQLGYESGAAALETEGLYKFMTKLRVATGGQVDTLTYLFPELRAMRGAFNLMSNDGETYSEVMDLMGDRSRAFGSTQLVLSEQAKSASFQLKLLRNTIMAPIISAFADQGPLVAGLTKNFREFVEGPPAEVRALFEHIGYAIDAVIDASGEVVEKLKPVAKAIGQLAVTGVGATLHAIAGAVTAVANVAGSASNAIAGFAVALGTRWVFKALAATRVAQALRGEMALFSGLMGMSGATTSGGRALDAYGAVMHGVSLKTAAANTATRIFTGALNLLKTNAVILGISAITAAVLHFTEKTRKAKEEVRDMVSSFAVTVDTKTIGGLAEVSEKIQTEINKRGEELETKVKVKPQAQPYWVSNEKWAATAAAREERRLAAEEKQRQSLKKKDAQYQELNRQQEKYLQLSRNADRNTQDIIKSTGAATNVVEKHAQAIGVDLTGAYEESNKARAKVEESITRSMAKISMSSEEIKKLTPEVLEAMMEDAEARADWLGELGKTYAEAGNVIGTFADEEEVTWDKIRKRQEERTKSIRDFGANIAKAYRLGLDPSIIKTYFEEGPAAGKELDAIVRGTEKQARAKVQSLNNLVGEGNKVQSLMVQIAADHLTIVENKSAEAVERAKVRFSALSKELATGSKAGAEQVAKELGMGVDRVRQIMDELGLNTDNTSKKVEEKVGGIPDKFKQAAEKAREWFTSSLNSGVSPVEGTMDRYVNAVLRGINTIRTAVGDGPITLDAQKWDVQDSKAVPRFADGGEWHQAQIASGAGTTTRVWAEPETGGEAYIPLHASKRPRSTAILGQVASQFGYALEPVKRYADGGLEGPPYLPAIGQLNPPANKAMDIMHTMAAKWIEEQSAIGSGWQEITKFLDRHGVSYSVTSTTGGEHAPGSYHFSGKAVDLIGDMSLIFDTLLMAQKNLSELFYTPKGFSIKNAQKTGVIAAGQHYDHVHAATFDRGGALRPGFTLARNNTGRTESVLTAQMVDRIVGALEGGRGGGTINVYEAFSPRETAREVNRRLRV